MNHKAITVVSKYRIAIWGILITMVVLSQISTPMASPAKAATLDSRYPGLTKGLLKSAALEPMDDNILLIAGNIHFKHLQLINIIKQQEPKLRAQLEKNLLFVLEKEATRQILLNEAQKVGISINGVDENRSIQALFEHKTKTLSVSEDEVRSFYAANKEMVGGAPLEQVADGIRQYLLQDRRQLAVAAYIDSLGNTARLRINESWVETQNRLAMDNPVDKARNSGKVTMVEFGATGCIPCDMMQPILDKLRKDFPEKLNVVFVHVGEEQILASRYGIRSIPVQVFFDAQGKEVFRHVGFFAEKEVLKQLKKTGL